MLKEAYHVYQQNKLGSFTFYGTIVGEYIKYFRDAGFDGSNHPYGSLEKDAYEIRDTHKWMK